MQPVLQFPEPFEALQRVSVQVVSLFDDDAMMRPRAVGALQELMEPAKAHFRRRRDRSSGGDGADDGLGDVLGAHGLAVRFVLGHCQRVRFYDDGLAVFVFHAVDKFFPERGLPGTGLAHHGEETAVRRGVIHHFPDVPDFRREIDVGGVLRIGEGIFDDSECLPCLHRERLLLQDHGFLAFRRIPGGGIFIPGKPFQLAEGIVDKGGLCAALFKQRGEPFFEPGPARFREGSPVQKLIDERRGDTELCGGLALTELRLFKERLYRRLIGDYPAHAALPSFGRNSSRRARFGANFSRIRSTTASISFPGTNSG